MAASLKVTTDAIHDVQGLACVHNAANDLFKIESALKHMRLTIGHTLAYYNQLEPSRGVEMPNINAAHQLAANTLSEALDEIMEQWKIRVKASLVDAGLQDDTTLENHLPIFLKRIIDSLHKHGGCDTSEMVKSGFEHGMQRSNLSHYTMRQTLLEYKLLRQIIFEKLRLHDCDCPAVSDVIMDSFDEAQSEAGESFHEDRHANDLKEKVVLEHELDTTSQKIGELESNMELNRRFVAGISHDLRNPLSAVTMALELLDREIDESSVSTKELTGLMRRSLDRADVILKNLLDANSISAGKSLPLKITPCLLTTMVQDLASDLEKTFSCTIRVEGEHNIEGYWDCSYLTRAIENLITNAAKYGTANSPVVVTLSQSSTKTYLMVHNDGLPIQGEDLKTIFEPFFRCKLATGPKKDGWGLGLSVVKAVVEAHHGSLSVISTQQGGTTFEITIPNDSRASVKGY